MKTLSSNLVEIDRPVRWDHPLDPGMLTRDVRRMLEQPPFAQMNRDLFPTHSTLEDVIRHDCRLLQCRPGDVVVREGEYGGSAFLVLDGSVRVFLESLWHSQQNSTNTHSSRWQDWLRSRFQSRSSNGTESPRVGGDPRKGQNHGAPEFNRRDRSRSQRGSMAREAKVAATPHVETVDGKSRIFIQDINAVVRGFQSEPIGVGEIFGEMAAITRSQHRYTVIADAESTILEIRWQGLRILRRDKNFREYLDARFRATSLQTHLRETSLFRFLDDETMKQVIAETKIESIGEREWFSDYRDLQKLDVQSQIQREPVIATEGHIVNDLILIRAGFARLSFEHGQGHQTVAYLGRGQMFGLSELAHRFRNPGNKPLPHQESLRALGFVDILRIPSDLVVNKILPKVRSSELPRPIVFPRYDGGGLVVSDLTSHSSLVKSTKVASEKDSAKAGFLETPLIEFLVDERLINGKQTMLIDLDRCTGCDDCVKACASTHDGIPRFVRNGPQYGPLMFAHACMHCIDPVCMIGCPTGAIARNQDTGIISINPNTCIGCKTCSESCPYDNIVMLQVRDGKGRAAVDRKTQLPILQASKCDLCQGKAVGPACQNACPHDALFRLDTSETKPLEHWLNRRVA